LHASEDVPEHPGPESIVDGASGVVAASVDVSAAESEPSTPASAKEPPSTPASFAVPSAEPASPVPDGAPELELPQLAAARSATTHATDAGQSARRYFIAFDMLPGCAPPRQASAPIPALSE
jgi:hypothetical protein